MRVISGLSVHFIKSCRATPLDVAELDERGIRYDRRWMVVDETGRFVTQRECPELAQVVPHLTEEGLLIEVEGDEHMRITVPRSIWEGESVTPITVWKHIGVGTDQGQAAGDFFSTHLHKSVRLVRMPEVHVRTPNRRPEGITTQVGFADGYPLLLATERSLAELNANLPTGHDPISMERFRPNIVVTGVDEAWEEERWNQFTVNGVLFHGVKPCERCPITQTDQRTGARVSKEPLRTLARIHRQGNAALFGANLIHASVGTLRVGSPIENIMFGERPEL